MANGYWNRLLRVDLSSGSFSVQQPGDLYFRRYLGGWGLIAEHLLRELPRGVDPLGPRNLLIFATGIYTGTPAAGSGRHAVGGMSPLTGGFGAAEAGGWWGAELARAGFDAVVISGAADHPVYLWIHDGQAELRDGSALWGLATAETAQAIRRELGDPEIRVASIGPAGERLSPLAAIMHDVNRAAARTGLGAVMGSKKLKAVVVRGTGRKQIADAKSLAAITREFTAGYPKTWLGELHDVGTSSGISYFQGLGALPTRNFREGLLEGSEAISGARMRDTILKRRDSCFACPVRCKRVVEVHAGEFSAHPVYGGPEYESIAALGSICGVAELAAIAQANELCNAYGLDTISTGVTIGWAMECFERGLIDERDTGGLALRFGDARMLVRLVESMGKREGFGRLLSEGSRRAAAVIGRGSEQFAMHVGGQELPMHDPRVKFGHALGYVASPTGADHMHNFHDSDYTTEEGIAGLKALGILQPLDYKDLGPAKSRMGAILIPWNALANALGCCLFIFPVLGPRRVVELVRAITGWDTSLLELFKAGERAYTLARACSAREGLRSPPEALPRRLFEPLPAGESAGNALPPEQFARALGLFYRMMGWDSEGRPEAWKLEELDVGWVVEVLDSSCGR